MVSAPHAPQRLAPNTVPSFYSGSGRIARWRGAEVSLTDPEDWIASCSRRTGMGDAGLTVLESGDLLYESINAHTACWHGPDNARVGAGMLLKLLDAGQRLPVHVHPDGSFAAENLGQPNGKAEAWLVLVAEPRAAVHLGFREAVDSDQLAMWVADQRVDDLLAAMNRIEVRSGDVLYCPPGVPHAIGAGVLIIELQEPSESSIMLEWVGFPIAADERFLGLSAENALHAVDRTGFGHRLDKLVGRAWNKGAGRISLLPEAASEYFVAESVAPDSALALEAAFSVLFVVEGQGIVAGGTETLTVSVGDVILVAWSAGVVELSGDMRVVRCHPR